MADAGDDLLPQRVRMMQIIVTALLLGVGSFCAVALVLVYQQGGQGMSPPVKTPLITVIAVFVALINVALSSTLSQMLARVGVRNIAAGTWQPPARRSNASYATDTLRLLAVRQNSLIIASAMLEGAAFLCIIAYLLEGQVYVLAGVAVTVGLMLANFPTTAGVRRWVDRQLDAVRQIRDEARTAN